MARRRRIRQLTWIALLIAGAGPGAGQAALASTPEHTPGREFFAAGTAAVHAEDYAGALAAFTAAVQAGMSGPAVYFNIGVCAWNLGELDLAENAFRRAADAPGMAALAHYNLALISLRRGDEAAAVRLFQQARDQSDDEVVRQLADEQLEILRPPVLAPARTRMRPAVFLAATAGYDDNVVLVADGELLGVSDTASATSEAQIAIVAPLWNAVRIEAGAYVLHYASLSEFDQAGLQGEVLYRRSVGGWTAELGANYGISQLDGERFEDRRGLSLTGFYPLGGAWDLRLRHRFEDLDGREPYDGLTGDRHESSIRVRRQLAAQRLSLEYRLELNDRESDELSPDRHRFDTEWTWRLHGRIQASLGAGWRYSRYSLREGSGWRERQALVSAGLQGPLGRRWEWTVRYDWTRNNATVDDFDYTRQRVIVGAQGLF